MTASSDDEDNYGDENLNPAFTGNVA